MSKTYVLGDIHGGFLGLKQVLEYSKFDKENDTLIFLGDVCDGWPQVKECIDELLTIKNLIHLLGNHDTWFMDFYTKRMNAHFTDDNYRCWTQHGGRGTMESYGFTNDIISNNGNFIELIPQSHLDYFKTAKLYYDRGDEVFVHAGFMYQLSIENQESEFYLWDRSLINYAYSYQNKKSISQYYTEIYVGHTPTISFNRKYKTPQNWTNVWAMDTGAAFTGNLSLMNIETKELFQSDPLQELYPDHPGRNKISFNRMKKNK